jgi:hypothetical protein
LGVWAFAVVVGAGFLAAAATTLAAGPVGQVTALTDGAKYLDFPAMCLDGQGVPWVAYVEWDGKADTLRLACMESGKLTPVAALAGPGVIHRPTIACDGKGYFGLTSVVFSPCENEPHDGLDYVDEMKANIARCRGPVPPE